MARRTGGRRAYATDLTDGQWALIAPLIPEAEPGGRPRKAPTRDLVDAIFYFLRAGMAWGLLPDHRQTWKTLYYYPRRYRRSASRSRPCGRRPASGYPDRPSTSRYTVR